MLYYVYNVDQDYDNNFFVIADTPEEAFEKASKSEWADEYITEELRDEQDVLITQIDVSKGEVSYLSYRPDEGVWEVELTQEIIN